MLLFVEGSKGVVTSVSFDLKDIVNFRVQRVMVDLLRLRFWHGNHTGKLIIGIYRNLLEVSPIISDNFIGSDKFFG